MQVVMSPSGGDIACAHFRRKVRTPVPIDLTAKHVDSASVSRLQEKHISSIAT